jgi:hypothetical protein
MSITINYTIRIYYFENKYQILENKKVICKITVANGQQTTKYCLTNIDL